MTEDLTLSTDVLIVGAGGAGMYAAVSAARHGAEVMLVDKSLIGRGGATIMAQMTVAAAVAEETEDHWQEHLADTLEAGRGLCNEELAGILCEEAPIRIREMDEWKVGWAREDGHIKQVTAPGHGKPRCCYVDFLNTGPAVAKTLRTRVAQNDAVTRISNLSVIELTLDDGAVTGALALNVETGERVWIAAGAVILAAGGLTRLFRRNSASINMGGDSYALALHAGAELIDMEFPQFFPIGHLAPRLVGMDPIMWDPFRYKLGGRLTNGLGEEFIENYGAQDSGTYTAPRDITAYAIFKEDEAGRATPAGGAYLSFQHLSEAELRDAFGPVIDRLANNGIDLTERSIEVSPIAHYHMGGIRVNGEMQTCVPGLFAAGEAVGGANGANRLSGNAIPEAFVFGERAGQSAAAVAKSHGSASAAASSDVLDQFAAHAEGARDKPEVLPGAIWTELQDIMWRQVGLVRNGEGLTAALTRIRAMQSDDLPALPRGTGGAYDMTQQDWFDLRAALLTAETVTLSALNRQESRGAHQRDDFPMTEADFAANQVLKLNDNQLTSSFLPVGAAMEPRS